MHKRLLIVDDNKDFRSLVKDYLKKDGLDLEIFEASSGEMGVVKASFVRPDIVLMDISLPNANGLESTRHIKEDVPECDVIIITMFDVEVFKQAAKKIKATAFIGKSEIYEQLMPVVKKCLDKK